MLRRFALLLALLPIGAHAELLIRNCPNPSGTSCAAPVYVRPADVTVAVVLRNVNGLYQSLWLPPAQIGPTERISVCKDDPALTVGGTTCTTRLASGDNWMMKSDALPATLGSVTFGWSAVTVNTDGSTLTDLAGYNVGIKRQDCDPALANCVAAGYDPPLVLGNVLTFAVLNVARQACVIVQARNAAGDVGPVSDETCGSPPKPKPVPAKVTGVRVVTP